MIIPYQDDGRSRILPRIQPSAGAGRIANLSWKKLAWQRHVHLRNNVVIRSRLETIRLTIDCAWASRPRSRSTSAMLKSSPGLRHVVAGDEVRGEAGQREQHEGTQARS